MKSVKIIKQDGDKVTLELDLAGDHGPSSSGKTVIVCSTNGSIGFTNSKGEQIKFSGSAYKKPSEEKPTRKSKSKSSGKK